MLHSNTRRRLEKTLYSNGINVALYNVENSDWYKNFMSDVDKAINKQVRDVVTKKNIEALLFFTKVNKDLITQISTLLIEIAKYINLADFLIKAGKEGGQAFFDKTGIEGKFVMKNPKVVNFFNEHSNLILNSVDDTTKEWIAKKLQEGKDNMLTSNEIVSSILDETDAFSKIRAERIVLTETANAMMITEISTAYEYGIKEIIWRTSFDDRVCETCLPLEGQRVFIGKSFPDGIYHPPAHPMCRCFIEEVIPDSFI